MWRIFLVLAAATALLGQESASFRYEVALVHVDTEVMVDHRSVDDLSAKDFVVSDNGKPVDVLEIPGNISDGDAKKLEELIWSRLPEAQELRANVGKFTDEKNASKISHPLALTQLLIAYHMVKAQVGVHAI